MENLIVFAQGDNGQLVGYLLIAVGILDILILHLFIGPQMQKNLPKEKQQNFERIKPLLYTAMAFLIFAGLTILAAGRMAT